MLQHAVNNCLENQGHCCVTLSLTQEIQTLTYLFNFQKDFQGFPFQFINVTSLSSLQLVPLNRWCFQVIIHFLFIYSLVSFVVRGRFLFMVGKVMAFWWQWQISSFLLSSSCLILKSPELKIIRISGKLKTTDELLQIW